MSTKLVNELHLVIHQNLEDLLPRILETWQEAKQGRRETKVSFVGLDDIEELTSYTWDANLEELITGCLESAFWMMDKAALASRREWKVAASKDPISFIDNLGVWWQHCPCGALYLRSALCCKHRRLQGGDLQKRESIPGKFFNWNSCFHNSIDIQANPLSTDFTPDQERRRLQEIASHRLTGCLFN